MNKNMVSILGICGALIVALTIGWLGGDANMNLQGIPVFALCGLLAFSIQWIGFIPAFIFKTEKYFDLIGSLTYISLIVVGFAYSGGGLGSVLVSAMVIIWAIRLGIFLFRRILKSGHDRRFAKIKTDFLQFLMTWTLQGLWVFVTLSAGLAALVSGQHYAVDGFVLAGCALWVVGFSIEVVADHQKSVFRSDANNSDQFISSGLWSVSRHPNYLGEILLWLGIAVAAYPMLKGWQLITLISPVFVYLLLTKISGVRMLEARAERVWGRDEEYRDYVRNTPALLPNFKRPKTAI
jgi:steroid 5-alpha reductase family enzyme